MLIFLYDYELMKNERVLVQNDSEKENNLISTLKKKIKSTPME